MSEFEYGMGWLREYPDFRDFTEETTTIAPEIKKLNLTTKGNETLKGTSSVDLRTWCPPIENQGRLGSCTAQAGVGLMEYFERRAFGRHIDASRLFLYKITRNLLGWLGDTGAYIRTTMGSLVLFGVPPERYWLYTDNITAFDAEPPAFCYSYARNYLGICYFRLDSPGISRKDLLSRIKLYLLAGWPPMFGFSVYSSIRQVSSDGKIPFPSSGERFLGGHAIVAVGFDDKVKITNRNSKQTTTGALLIRNSWSTRWGDQGYGWLPYKYIESGLTADWWTLMRATWVDSKQFGIRT